MMCSDLHESICRPKLVLWYDESSNWPQGTRQQAVGHPQDHHCYVGVEHGEVEEGVAPDGDYDGEEDPGDVPARLVNDQAQERGGGGGDQVDQADDLVGLLI